MKVVKVFVPLILLCSCALASTPNHQLTTLFGNVEKLNLGRGGYILGKTLNTRQKNIARMNPDNSTNPGTYKFKDGDIYVVAEQTTDRVLIIYEQYDATTLDKIRNLVGSLYLDFGDPTVIAHDKLIYWVYNEKEKLSDEKYHAIKKANEGMQALATIKLSSGIPIHSKKNPTENNSVYYIISSEPVLKLISSP